MKVWGLGPRAYGVATQGNAPTPAAAQDQRGPACEPPCGGLPPVAPLGESFSGPWLGGTSASATSSPT